jgi:signal transduction histidine kinase
MRMRTILLLSLMSLACGLTAVSLFVIRSSMATYIRSNLSADLTHSTATFQNLQKHNQQMLDREVALLADLPSLKSLMITRDVNTIQDGGIEFWRVSGSDLFALLDASGAVSAVYCTGVHPDRRDIDPQLKMILDSQPDQRYVITNHRLYQVSFHPLFFGSDATGTPLGFVIAGYAIDEGVSKEVREAASADVIFLAGSEIVSSTLDTKHNAGLQKQAAAIATQGAQNDIRLDKERYLAAALPISTLSGLPVRLLVLKSYDQASTFVMRLNRLLLGLGLLVLLVSTVLALYISSTITRPLEALVAGARALGAGSFDYQLHRGGAKELNELSAAFDLMRSQLRQSQQDLVESARLAIIGRMASSISHDLRHYLSAIYANAEFLSHPSMAAADKEELMADVKLAVQGMTDVLESLLIFSRTGRSLHPSYESLPALVERATALIRMHPDAHSVLIRIDPLPQIEMWIDARMIERAVCNLLSNAVQAAKAGSEPAWVRVTLAESPGSLDLCISDSGPGVPEAVRDTLFEPFVSGGKKRGIGLGLTIASRIAQEHGGNVRLEDTHGEHTTFTLSLPRTVLETHRPLNQAEPTSLSGRP